MGDQTADMLERALRRDHSGNWPLVMPSDILALVENFRHKSQRIAELEANLAYLDTAYTQAVSHGAKLERERALLLRYVRAADPMIHPRTTERPNFYGATPIPIREAFAPFKDARAALIDAGLLGGDDE